MAADYQHQQTLIEYELAQVFTPTEPVTDPAKFAGRGDAMDRCLQQLKGGGGGVTFVIYGESGIGKSSFADRLFFGRDTSLIVSSRVTDFTAIFLTLLARINQHFTAVELEDMRKAAASLGVEGVASVGAELQETTKHAAVAKQELDLNFILDRLSQPSIGLQAVIIDEFDRIENPRVRLQLIEVAKGLADRRSKICLALVGTAQSYEDLLGNPPDIDRYIGRHIFPEKLERMERSELAQILEQRRYFVECEPETRDEIAWISSGFPSNVHQLGRTASFFWLSRNLMQMLRRLSAQQNLIGRLARLFTGTPESVTLNQVGVRVGFSELDRAVGALADSFARYHERVRPIVEEAEHSDVSRAILREFGNRSEDAIGEEELARSCSVSTEALRAGADLLLKDIIRQDCAEG